MAEEAPEARLKPATTAAAGPHHDRRKVRTTIMIELLAEESIVSQGRGRRVAVARCDQAGMLEAGWGRATLNERRGGACPSVQ